MDFMSRYLPFKWVGELSHMDYNPDKNQITLHGVLGGYHVKVDVIFKVDESGPEDLELPVNEGLQYRYSGSPLMSPGESEIYIPHPSRNTVEVEKIMMGSMYRFNASNYLRHVDEYNVPDWAKAMFGVADLQDDEYNIHPDLSGEGYEIIAEEPPELEEGYVDILGKEFYIGPKRDAVSALVYGKILDIAKVTGITELYTFASREDSGISNDGILDTGYKTWPIKYGYDSVEDDVIDTLAPTDAFFNEREIPDEARDRMKELAGPRQSVLQLVSTDEGKALWSKFGDGFSAVKSLEEESISDVKQLVAVMTKFAKKRNFFYDIIDEEGEAALNAEVAEAPQESLSSFTKEDIQEYIADVYERLGSQASFRVEDEVSLEELRNADLSAKNHAAKLKINKETQPFMYAWLVKHDGKLDWSKINTQQELLQIAEEQFAVRTDKESYIHTPESTEKSERRHIAAARAAAQNGNEEARDMVRIYDQNPQENWRLVLDRFINPERMQSIDEWLGFLESIEDVFLKDLLWEIPEKTLKSNRAYGLGTVTTVNPIILTEIQEALEKGQSLGIVKHYNKRSKELALIKAHPDSFQSTNGVWVKVPQTAASSPDYDNAIQSVRDFSRDCMCTKTYNAKYIEQGDMWFLVDTDNLLTEAVVRLVGGDLKEIVDGDNSHHPYFFQNDKNNRRFLADLRVFFKERPELATGPQFELMQDLLRPPEDIVDMFETGDINEIKKWLLHDVGISIVTEENFNRLEYLKENPEVWDAMSEFFDGWIDDHPATDVENLGLWNAYIIHGLGMAGVPFFRSHVDYLKNQLGDAANRSIATYGDGERAPGWDKVIVHKQGMFADYDPEVQGEVVNLVLDTYRDQYEDILEKSREEREWFDEFTSAIQKRAGVEYLYEEGKDALPRRLHAHEMVDWTWDNAVVRVPSISKAAGMWGENATQEEKRKYAQRLVYSQEEKRARREVEHHARLQNAPLPDDHWSLVDEAINAIERGIENSKKVLDALTPEEKERLQNLDSGKLTGYHVENAQDRLTLFNELIIDALRVIAGEHPNISRGTGSPETLIDATSLFIKWYNDETEFAKNSSDWMIPEPEKHYLQKWLSRRSAEVDRQMRELEQAIFTTKFNYGVSRPDKYPVSELLDHLFDERGRPVIHVFDAYVIDPFSFTDRMVSRHMEMDEGVKARREAIDVEILERFKKIPLSDALAASEWFKSDIGTNFLLDSFSRNDGSLKMVELDATDFGLVTVPSIADARFPFDEMETTIQRVMNNLTSTRRNMSAKTKLRLLKFWQEIENQGYETFLWFTGNTYGSSYDTEAEAIMETYGELYKNLQSDLRADQQNLEGEREYNEAVLGAILNVYDKYAEDELGEDWEEIRDEVLRSNNINTFQSRQANWTRSFLQRTLGIVNRNSKGALNTYFEQLPHISEDLDASITAWEKVYNENETLIDHSIQYPQGGTSPSLPGGTSKALLQHAYPPPLALWDKVLKEGSAAEQERFISVIKESGVWEEQLKQTATAPGDVSYIWDSQKRTDDNSNLEFEHARYDGADLFTIWLLSHRDLPKNAEEGNLKFPKEVMDQMKLVMRDFEPEMFKAMQIQANFQPTSKKAYEEAFRELDDLSPEFKLFFSQIIKNLGEVMIETYLVDNPLGYPQSHQEAARDAKELMESGGRWMSFLIKGAPGSDSRRESGEEANHIKTIAAAINPQQVEGPDMSVHSGEVEAYYDRDQDEIVFNASAIKSPERAGELAFHELTHRNVFLLPQTEEGRKELRDTIKLARPVLRKNLPELLNKTGHNSLEELKADYKFSGEDAEAAVDFELLARFSERLQQQEPTLFKTIVAKIRAWLRKFANIKMSENDLLVWLRNDAMTERVDKTIPDSVVAMAPAQASELQYSLGVRTKDPNKKGVLTGKAASQSDEVMKDLGLRNMRLARWLSVSGQWGETLHPIKRELAGKLTEVKENAVFYNDSIHYYLKQVTGSDNLLKLRKDPKWANLVEDINTTLGSVNDDEMIDRYLGPARRQNLERDYKKVLRAANRTWVMERARAKKVAALGGPKNVTKAANILSQATENRRIATEIHHNTYKTELGKLYADAAKLFRVEQAKALSRVGKYSPELADSLSNMRQAINELQEQLTNSEILVRSKETLDLRRLQAQIKNSKGVYLNLSYEGMDNHKSWGHFLETASDDAIDRWNSGYQAFEEELLEREAANLAKKHPTLTPTALMNLARSLNVNDPKFRAEIQDKMKSFLANFGKDNSHETPGLINTKVLRHRADITKGKRLLAGQYEDNVFNASRTMIALGTLLANNQFLEDTYQQLEDLNAKAKAEGRKDLYITKSEKEAAAAGLISVNSDFDKRFGGGEAYGPMNNMYVHPATREAFLEFAPAEIGAMHRHVLTIAAQSMANKTTRRLRTHIRNFIGSPMFLTAMGDPHVALLHFAMGASTAGQRGVGGVAVRNIQKKYGFTRGVLKIQEGLGITNENLDTLHGDERRQLLAEYNLFGVMGQDVAVNAYEEIKQAYKKEGLEAPPMGFFLSGGLVQGEGLAKAKKHLWIGGTIDQAHQGFYQSEDDYWKITAFESQLQKIASKWGVVTTGKTKRFFGGILDPMETRRQMDNMSAEQVDDILDAYPPTTPLERRVLKDEGRKAAAIHMLKREASNRLNIGMPNYTAAVAWVRTLKKYGLTAFIAPFITFHAEVGRIIVDIPRKLILEDVKLYKRTGNKKFLTSAISTFLGYGFTVSIAGSTISKAAGMIFGLFGKLFDDDDDEEERALPLEWSEENKAGKEFQSHYYEHKDTAVLSRVGDSLKWMDTSYILPHASIVDPIKLFFRILIENPDELEGHEALWSALSKSSAGIVSPYFKEQLWVDAIDEALGEESIHTQADPYPLNRGGAVAKALIGTQIPGTITDSVKPIKAILAGGSYTEYGRRYTVVDEAVSQVMGTKVIETNIPDQLGRGFSKWHKAQSDATREFTSKVKAADTLSEREMARSLQKARFQHRLYYNRARRMYVAAVKLVGKEKADIELDQAPFNKATKYAIQTGKFRPWTVTDATLDAAYEAGIKMKDDRMKFLIESMKVEEEQFED